MVLSHIELAKVVTGCTNSRRGSTGDCEDIQLDPVVVNIPLGPGINTVALSAVPEGKYAEFHASIDVVRPGDDQQGAKAFLAANPAFANVSVKVTGIYKKPGAADQRFTYTIDKAVGEIEKEFTPNGLTVTSSSTPVNITVSVDVASWFTGVSNPVSPTAADRALIETNIRNSFKVFEDNSKEGVQKP
jgi:hypothetical protein